MTKSGSENSEKEKDAPGLSLVVFFSLFVIGAVYLASIVLLALKNQPIDFVEMWARWDASHYLSIAQEGYQNYGERAVLIAFFPLFPLVIRFGCYFFGDYFLSSLVAANFFYLLSMVFLYKLVALDHNRKTAFRTVVLISIFPAAYFFHAPYTESLFLLLTILSFYYARRKNWLGASIAAAFAGASRVSGVLIPVALLVEFFAQKPKGKDLRRLWYFSIMLLGPTLYLLINYFLFSSPFHFLEVQRSHWFHAISSPFSNFARAFDAMFWRDLGEGIMLGFMQILFVLLALALIIISFAKVRLSYFVYTVISVLFITLPSFWISIPRYVLVIFPLFIVMAILSEKKAIYGTIIVFSVALLGLFLSFYVRGQWAF